MNIRLLDDHTISHIAAGEVVARPASVVKELMENSLDAGAGRIQVTLEGGGRTLMQVTDDGRGMLPDEVELALKRHATSKIENFGDLERVSTYGFRGEALPSIAAVSRLEIASRPPGSEGGFRVAVEGGEAVEQGPVGMPPGTRVTVKDLFFNTPARRKQLRSQAAELRQILRTATSLALARPGVAVEVRSQGTRLQTSGSGDLRVAYLELQGAEKGRRMTPFGPTRSGKIEAWGLVGTGDMAAGTRAQQLVFINGRPVMIPAVARALDDALRPHTPARKHIPVVVHLSMPPGQVDANVHPAKSEVRLDDEGEIYRLTRRAVEGAVGSVPPAYRRGSLQRCLQEAPSGFPFQGRPQQSAGEDPVSLREEQSLPLYMGKGAPEPPELRPVGVIMDTYIVAQGDGRAVLIDQHAAHERVVYERLVAQRERGSVEAQNLVSPVRVDLSAEEFETYREHQESLDRMGFSVERFGERSLLVRSVPRGVGGQVFRDLLNVLVEGGRPAMDPQERIVLYLAACRGAVMAGQRLSLAEMEGLLSQLLSTSDPRTCPHGRPTMVELKKAEIDRWFGR